jgi:hypothetical protein
MMVIPNSALHFMPAFLVLLCGLRAVVTISPFPIKKGDE